MERVIDANDRPRAEVVLDVSIMEVNRQRMKQYGLDLSQYSITGIFSPEVAPTAVHPHGRRKPDAQRPAVQRQHHFAPASARRTSTSSCRQAIARFLESDTRTKLIAKPQLRGQEGQKITLNLGDEIPVPQTTFGSFGGAGSLATQPISSFNYRPVGVNVDHDPARDVRQRHRPRAHRREQHARRRREHRGPEPAVVRLAQGRDEDSPARRRVARCWPACCARTSGGR